MSDFLQTSEQEAKEFLPRYNLLYGVILIGCLLISGRLWFLQILQGSELRQFSEKNRVKETKLPAPRGLFLDRENRVLVDNLPGFDASIAPQYAKKLDETSEAVGEVLGIPGRRIAEEVNAPQTGAQERIIRNGSHAVGDRDAGQSGAASERMIRNSGHTVRDRDAAQASAAPEPPVTDRGHAGGDAGTGQTGAVLERH